MTKTTEIETLKQELQAFVVAHMKTIQTQESYELLEQIELVLGGDWEKHVFGPYVRSAWDALDSLRNVLGMKSK